MKDLKNLEKVKKLREAGLTYDRIGKKFGISRQRVHQLLTKYEPPRAARNKLYMKKRGVELSLKRCDNNIRYFKAMIKVQEVQKKYNQRQLKIIDMVIKVNGDEWMTKKKRGLGFQNK